MLAGAGQSLMHINFSFGDEFILGASNDNTIRIWKMETQRLMVRTYLSRIDCASRSSQIRCSV